MRKIFLFVGLLFFSLSFMSCDKSEPNSKDYTYMQAAEYLSSLDGLFQLGCDYYRQPDPRSTEPYFTGWYSIPVKDNTVYINKFGIYGKTLDYYGSSTSMYLEHIRFEDLLCVKHPEYFHQISVLEQYPKNENVMYLGLRHDNLGYLFEEYNVKTSPHWTEWVDYDIRYQRRNRNCEQGRGCSFWYNPMTEKLEECIYLRELDGKTEIYVIFQQMSLFYDWATYMWYSPFFMSEELFEKIENELGDSFNEENYKKGSVLEFYNWYSGEYSEKVSDIFKKVRKDVYYPETYGHNYLAELLSEQGYTVPKIFIEDMINLGVDYDNIMVNIIKITVPHDGTTQDILWELIG